MSIPKLYTREEVAEILKVDVRTIDRWRREGKIKARRVGPNVVRFEEAEVKKLIDTETK